MLRESERGIGRRIESEEWKEGEKQRKEEVGRDAVGRREKGRLYFASILFRFPWGGID